MKSYTAEAIDILSDTRRAPRCIAEERTAKKRRLELIVLDDKSNKGIGARHMTFISSTSGRTLALQEITCGGLSVTVYDGREDGRSILLDREGAKQLSDALAAWLRSSQPHERIEHETQHR
jgi:hypothetical protein